MEKRKREIICKSIFLVSIFIFIFCIFLFLYKSSLNKEFTNIDYLILVITSLSVIVNLIHSIKVKDKNYIRGNVMLIFFILIFSITIFTYEPNITFDKIVNIENYKSIDKAIFYNNEDKNSLQEKVLSEEEILEAINILNDFTYEKTIHLSNYGKNGKVLVLHYNNSVIVIEVWEAGYLRIPDRKVFKVQSESKEELFNKIDF